MELRIEFSDTEPSGPFEPLMRLSISDWNHFEDALVAVTDGRPPIGYYRVRSDVVPGVRLLAWDGDEGIFRVLRGGA